jgi:hypothetical protein
MVFTEFTRKISLLSMGFLLIAPFKALQAQDELLWPVYAAQLSDKVLEHCQINTCEMNVLNAEALSQLLNEHPLKYDVNEALTLSEYELLISSAIIKENQDGYGDAASSTLVLEMSTSWRGIIVDDYNVETFIDSSLEDIAKALVDAWVSRVQYSDVFSAERIYHTIGASDYENQMQLPEKIGDFVRSQSALYHDPLQGIITRYLHPDFADAVVDISVYPVSPFTHAHHDFSMNLSAEMQIEKSQIEALIKQAKMQDYQISEIQSTELGSAQSTISGLAMEVALETQIDPVYSTQILFTQNDKFIKLTGNVPKHMMLALANESVAHIKVPQESAFMHSMRQ